ncbi:MAG: NADH-quinone oxidoreductase subunit J [Candidatus Aquirickettsiella sp.]
MIIPIQSCAFFGFAVLLIVAAFMTIISRNPVRCALFLVLAFFAAAALWILLEAEFLGLILILVYVGAVMTLFLFVIMTLNIDNAEKQYGLVRYWFFAVISVLILLALLIYAVWPLSGKTGLLALSAQASNTQALGDVLYTQYAYPFEITGVLLLVGIIATIALSFREKRLNKAIAPELQFKVKASDRLRMIKMPAERKK